MPLHFGDIPITDHCQNRRTRKCKIRKDPSSLSPNLVKKRSCFKSRSSTSLLHFSLWLLLMFSLFPSTCSKSLKYKRNRPDLLCNVGDEHECVCNRSRGDLDIQYMPCDYFLEVGDYTLLSIKMRHVNLNARLYTNESYQQYFRRRIANIISKYCEDRSDECQTPISNSLEEKNMREQVGKNPHSFVNSTANNHLSALDDEDEPPLTLENVVLLRVVFLEKNRTEVYFVVTKGANAGSLNSVVLMDPEKVKYIMSAQIAPLSRVLGGIHIEELRLSEFRKKRPPADNTRLMTMIAVIGVAIAFCYFVVAVKQFRDWRQKRTTQKKKEQPEKGQKSTRNYGTCTDHFLPNYEALNGKTKKKKSIAQKFTADITENNKLYSNNTNKIGGVVVSQSTPTFEARNYQNMFACDASQLPQEIVFEQPKGGGQLSFNYNNDNRTSQSASEIEDDAFLPESLHSTNQSAQSKIKHSMGMSTAQLPSVVLVSSVSQNEIIPEKNNNNNKKMELHAAIHNSGFLDTNKGMPFERPLSRRGSRDSTPEQGQEECEDDREETPQPIGDENVEVITVPGKPKEPKKQGELNSSIQHQFSSSPVWSSDSEEEDEMRTVYHPLEASDEDEISPKKSKSSIDKSLVKNGALPRLLRSDISDSENEYTEPSENKMLDRHHYQRLQESPIPFTDPDTKSFELDSTLDLRHE